MKLIEENLHRCILPEGKSDTTYADDDLQGFGIRVRRDVKGRVKRKWFYQYRTRTDGKQHRINLGNVDSPAAVPATKARQKATEHSISAQLGDDPQKKRKEAKKDQKRRLLDEALKYLDDRKNGIVGKRPMRLSTFKAAKRYFELHWGALAARPVAFITEAEVQHQLRKIIDQHGKIAAARAKSFLSAFYAWAMKEGLAKTNPTINTQDIAKNDPRTRVLSDDEIRAIWSAGRADDFGRIVRLLFFTGCRRDEIGGLKWNEIDLDNSALSIGGGRTKSGRELRLTLPAAAAAILRQAPRRAGRDFLFGERGGAFQRWSWEKMALDKRLVEAGHQFEPWTLHDIRRTVRTRLAKIGIAPHVAELVLNHVGHRRSVDGAVYDHHPYQLEIADALMRWSVALMAIVEPPTESNVTPMLRATA